MINLVQFVDKTPVVVLLKVEEIGEQPSIHDINALEKDTIDSDNNKLLITEQVLAMPLPPELVCLKVLEL